MPPLSNRFKKLVADRQFVYAIHHTTHATPSASAESLFVRSDALFSVVSDHVSDHHAYIIDAPAAPAALVPAAVPATATRAVQRGIVEY
jgi:hypothetical protein